MGQHKRACLQYSLEAGLLGDGVHAVEADQVQVLPHDELLQRSVPPQYNTTPRQCHAGFNAQSFTNYGHSVAHGTQRLSCSRLGPEGHQWCSAACSRAARLEQ